MYLCILDRFIYLGSKISSAKSDVKILIDKTYTAIQKLMIIWEICWFGRFNAKAIPLEEQ